VYILNIALLLTVNEVDYIIVIQPRE